MTRRRVVILSVFALLATVPWFFEPTETHASYLGFPLWALYSLCVTVIYAIIIACLVGKYWSKMAGEGEGD